MPDSAPAPRRARRLLLCAGGAYLSYTLPGFILHLLKHVADDVQVVLSRAATKMVSKYAVEVASRNPVFVEMDDGSDEIRVPHIELARQADLVLVYPASVGLIGKIANGIADELIAALVLATDRPVLFVPIANVEMLEHPAVLRNFQRLRDDGYVVLPPLAGPEIATREGMEHVPAFPMPHLQVQLAAALGEGGPGRVRRK